VSHQSISAGAGEDRLTLISHVARKIASARRLTVEDARDFSQTVHLKFLEGEYQVFARFEGRSSLETFLTTVVTRMLQDWRNQKWGKWRPTATAVRLGATAIALERLTARDGFTFNEAIEILARRPTTRTSRTDLEQLATQLPRRVRRHYVSDAVLEELPGSGFPDPIEDDDRRRRQRDIRRALRHAIAQLSERDQWLLHERFQRRKPVSAIAKGLSVDCRSLYRHFDALQGRLRRVLNSEGITGSAAD
jgi:RNA polymerase sigma factor (sigma-70 family)